MGLIEKCKIFIYVIRNWYGFQCLRVGLSMKVEDDTVKGGEDEVFQEYEKRSHGFSSASLDLEINQRKRNNVYREILQSYDELQTRSKRLEEAKTKILGYECLTKFLFFVERIFD